MLESKDMSYRPQTGMKPQIYKRVTFITTDSGGDSIIYAKKSKISALKVGHYRY